MKEKLRQFMTGRYGADQLGRFLMGVSIGSLIIYMLSKFDLFYMLTLFCLIWYYYRALSRNCGRRYEENLKFLRLRSQVSGRFRQLRIQMDQRKVYRFYTCPSCKQKVRVPRGKGKIAITCPRCHTEFIRKS